MQHQEVFQEILSSADKRKRSTHTEDEMSNKITLVTTKWHQLSTYVSEQYQILSLSLHFTQASENILSYLNNIEEKLKSNIPEDVKEKIQEENEKAKVGIKLLSSSLLIQITLNKTAFLFKGIKKINSD